MDVGLPSLCCYTELVYNGALDMNVKRSGTTRLY